MRRRAVVIISVALALVFGSTAATAARRQTSTGVDGRYLVVFKTDALPADAAGLVKSNGGTVVRTFEQIGVIAATGDAGFRTRIAKSKDVLAVGAERIFTAPPVRMVEVDEDVMVTEDGPLAADSYYGYQWDIRRIGAPAVWDRFPLGGATPRVAVLDVGVMDTHPDLVGQVDASVATSYCPTADGYPVYTTYIDLDTYPDWSPGDACSALPHPFYEAHGTHVAGTIAAKFGGGKVVGVAPDAQIGAYKVFDYYVINNHLYSGAFDGPVFDAIIEATDAGYPVISMSLGGYAWRADKGDNASYLAWDRVAKWANRHGALIVASAGNEGYDLNGPLAHVPSDLPTVLSTSATAAAYLSGPPYFLAPGADYLASYSNYGAAVDIAAPGGDCPPSPLSCSLQYFIVNDGIDEDTGAATYYAMAGTSMATPHVSAVAAWVRALHPDWSPGDVRSWLKETAEKIGSRQYFGAGMVDADAATQ